MSHHLTASREVDRTVILCEKCVESERCRCLIPCKKFAQAPSSNLYTEATIADSTPIEFFYTF